MQLATRAVSAQNDPQFSQYFLNQSVFNPGYNGLDNALSATAQFRSQWMGIEGHPFIQDISVHSPVPLLHGGLGILLLNEEEGVLRNTFVSAGYAYHIRTNAGTFSIGVSGGAVQSSLDGSKLRAPDGNYIDGINHNDDILPGVMVSGIGPDFAAGIFFAGRKFTAGISANHLIPVDIKLDGTNSNLSMIFARQYYLQVAYFAPLGNTISIRPSLMVKSNGSYLQGEGDVVLTYNNFLWFGAGFRGYSNQTLDAIIGTVGIRIGENLRLGYSYDYTTSSLNSVSNGSHEVVINYRVNLIKPAKPGKIIYTPRF
ncbi:MAG: PorP/SprF family type IX secretion system membrane protein [Chitinophagales bacterium]|nr:PorP/SprF family type IX secretion system membrane protein [Chitinophagales bacterium]